MGNYSSAFNIPNNESLKQERLIDEENKIYIGIVSPKPHTNPYSSQAIRIGDFGKLYRLQKFIETSNSLIFEYESNTSMTLSKRDNEIIVNINEHETNTHIIKPMDSIPREIYKPIHFGNLANEYDKIPEFIRPKYELESKLTYNSVVSHQPMER